MSFEGLSHEVMEKAKACASIEELRALCAEQGNELSDEELVGVNGGIEDLPTPDPCRYYYGFCEENTVPICNRLAPVCARFAGECPKDKVM